MPDEMDVHLIVDNHCTNKHAQVRAWLALRPRFHVHYTPTYVSWLKQVELAGALVPPRGPSATGSSRRQRSGGAAFPASRNGSPKSSSSWPPTTRPRRRPTGSPRRIQSLRSSSDLLAILRDGTLADHLQLLGRKMPARRSLAKALLIIAVQ